MSGEFRSFCFFASGNIQSSAFTDNQYDFVDTRARSETSTLTNATLASGGFIAGTVSIISDCVSGNMVAFSFGRDISGTFVVHGILNGGESIVMDRRFEERVYLRVTGASGTGGVVRIFAW